MRDGSGLQPLLSFLNVTQAAGRPAARPLAWAGMGRTYGALIPERLTLFLSVRPAVALSRGPGTKTYLDSSNPQAPLWAIPQALIFSRLVLTQTLKPSIFVPIYDTTNARCGEAVVP